MLIKDEDKSRIIRALRQQLVELDRERGEIARTIRMMMDGGVEPEVTQVPKMAKSAHKPIASEVKLNARISKEEPGFPFHSWVINSVKECFDKQGGKAVSVADLHRAWEINGVKPGGKSSIKTRISGALSREITKSAHPRVKRVGAGLYMPI